MSKNEILLILGNQLFPLEYIRKTNVNKIFMAEDFGLTTDAVALSSDTADLKFLYIKNTGSNTVEISLDSTSPSSGTYPIKLSPNASTMLRGTSDLDRDT